MSKKAEITDQTRGFIGNWILTDFKGKYKAYYDVWDIVLRNYLPKERPLLFRSCRRRYDGRIASFTRCLECARKFSDESGFLIVCDTQETLIGENHLYGPGKYKHSFYPLVKVLEMARDGGGWGFSGIILRNYIGEEEYIMRVDLENMDSFKWIKDDPKEKK